MSYVGNIPAEKYSSLTQQTFSTPTGTSFTLSQSVTNSTDIALFVDNVRQDPSTYTAVGTALTTSTISSPSTMYCLYNGRTTETISPASGSVDSSHLVAGSVDDSHISGLAASKLTGALPAISGASLTAVPAANLTGTLPAISGANLTGLPSTPYLHTVQNHVITTSSQSLVALTVTNVTNLNATITPTAGTQILVTVRWNGEGSHTSSQQVVHGLRRDTTIVGNPATVGSRHTGMSIPAQGYYNVNSDSTPESCVYQYLDSPSTGSAITYHATISSLNAETLYNNRCVSDTDSNGMERLTSTITLQEVVAP
jgi:hypothetical protein